MTDGDDRSPAAELAILPELLHVEERKVWGDGGFQGETDAIQMAIQMAAPKAEDTVC